MTYRRIRWYSLTLDRRRLRDLATAIGNTGYDAKRGHGFILDEVRPTFATGRHIERIERDIIGVDPFGGETRQRVTTFAHAQFTISAAPPGLEVIDPPRSVKMLFTQLGALSNFELAIDSIEVDPLVWLTAIERGSTNAVVAEVEYTEIAFKGGTTGALTVRGVNDVRDAGTKIVGDRPKVVKRVGARLQRRALPSLPVELSRDGRAEVPAEHFDTVAGLLRAALVSATSRAES
jgi:hypothetical protein